jgi:3-(3-hydroxy-phenyl)propionate hydroxylase
MRDSDRILIVGGGPVGLVTAALLAKHGVSSVVVEADEGFCTGSRAICLSRRSLEILDWCGAAVAVKGKGLAWRSGRSYFRDQQVLKFDMPAGELDRFAPMTNIQQFYVEQFVSEAIARQWPDRVQVLWNTRLTGLVQHPNHVLATVQGPDGARQLEAGWLVACDGGKSTVRELLCLSMQGTNYEGRYVIADVKQSSNWLLSNPVERLAWFDPPTNRGSTLLMHRQPDDVWRIDYQVGEHEDPQEAIKPDKVLPRIQAHLDWMGETQPWEPLWISIYNAKCLSLESYLHNRVLFAGDAAHLVPIFGVRGLNSGIDDAANLAWKLAAVVQGKAHRQLLQSYCDERRAAALINIEYGKKSTEFMSPPHAGFNLMREAALRLATGYPELSSLINPRQTTPVRYPNYADAYDVQQPGPGMVAPDLALSDGYLSEALGQQPVLLCIDCPKAPDLGQLAHSHAIKVIWVNSKTSEQAKELYQTVGEAAFLLRPDGYVHKRWGNCPSAWEVGRAIQSMLKQSGT